MREFTTRAMQRGFPSGLLYTAVKLLAERRLADIVVRQPGRVVEDAFEGDREVGSRSTSRGGT